MTTKSLQPLFDQWEAIEATRKATRQNNELSEIGKLRAYEKLDIRRAELRENALEAFTREYAAQARAMDANSKARGKALENSLARFQNLSAAIDIEAERVSRLLKSNKSAFELILEFRDNRDSGALVVAWRRALADAPTNTQGLDQLRIEVDQEYRLLKETDEVKKVNARGKELADAAIELRDDTIKFMTLLSRSGDVSAVPAKLQNLMLRIKVTPLQNGMVNVTFGDSPDEAMRKLAQQDSTKPYFVIGGQSNADTLDDSGEPSFVIGG